MSQPVFVLDACVLYPVAVRDLLLTLAALDAFEPRWTPEILDEMRRNVLADHPDVDPRRFDERMIGAMATAFPDALVTDYAHLVGAMDNEPSDRHVAAAGVAAGAGAIITDNVRHFGGNVLAAHGITACSPSDYVAGLLRNEPSVVVAALQAIANRKRNPPRSVDDIIDSLARCTGFARLIAELRDVV